MGKMLANTLIIAGCMLGLGQAFIFNAQQTGLSTLLSNRGALSPSSSGTSGSSGMSGSKVMSGLPGMSGSAGMSILSGLSGLLGVQQRPAATTPPLAQRQLLYGPYRMTINNKNTLQQVCEMAVATMGGNVSDHLADVMSNAVNFLRNVAPMQLPQLNPMVRDKWSCLWNDVTKFGTNLGNGANGMSDYFDTVSEMPLFTANGSPFSPCDMIFCGEAGITPTAVMHEMHQYMFQGRPLSSSVSAVFGAGTAPLFHNRLGQLTSFLPPSVPSANPAGQPASSGNAAGMVGTSGNSVGQTGTSNNNVGQSGTSQNNMSAGNNNVGQSGTSQNNMNAGNTNAGQPATSQNNMGTPSSNVGQATTSQNNMGTVGQTAGNNPGAQWGAGSGIPGINFGMMNGLESLMTGMNSFSQMATAQGGGGNDMGPFGAGSGGNGMGPFGAGSGGNGMGPFGAGSGGSHMMQDAMSLMMPGFISGANRPAPASAMAGTSGTMGGNSGNSMANVMNMAPLVKNFLQPSANQQPLGGASGNAGAGAGSSHFSNLLGTMMALQHMQEAPEQRPAASPALGMGGANLWGLMNMGGSNPLAAGPQPGAGQAANANTVTGGNTGGMIDIFRMLG